MKSDYTRTGARRAGDDYQDIVALEILVELLEHPTRYQWIRVEADDAGSLDDVVAQRNDGSFVAKQVKFSTAPESEKDVLTWDKLLRKKESRRGELLPSLLEKWASSMEQLNKQGAVHEASVVSNRKAAKEVQTTLSSEGLVDFGKIGDSAIQDRIVQQLGDEARARSFFAEFHFFLDRSSLDDYEEAVRRRFYGQGGKPKGWLNLKDKLRFWIRNRNQPPPNGAITLSAVWSAGLWHQLQSLPQQFEVPKDYVLPSQDFHKGFEQDLLALQKGCMVLTASPGVGKSTYLSYLFGQLVEQDVPVIRHHYSLSPSDRTVGRLEFHRVAESLMSDIQSNFPKACEDVQTRNPNPADLSLWIDSCGQYFAQQERALIIILDGLDHVWREQGSGQELDRLFEHLLPVPDGVVILLGTQPVDDIQLPLSLKRAALRNQWRELPLLNRSAVGQWVQYHSNELELSADQPAHDFLLERLSSAFFNKSQGHPLHLRYTLKSLQEQDMPPTDGNIDHLPGCTHQDIIAYYEELWYRVPEESREILHLFAACDFPWPKEGIIDCLGPHARNHAIISEALRQVSNLMVRDHLGLRPFHSSLLVFIQGQTDHANHSQRMKKYALDWLQTKAPDYWRWAYQWLLEEDLGNDQSLINGPNRQWAVETITKGLPRQEASEILARSSWSALQNKNLPRFVEVGLLRDYFNFAYESRSEVIETLLHPLLTIEEDPHLRARLYANIANLAEMELALLAENEASHGNQSVVSECFDELNERMTGARVGPRRKTLDGWRSHVKPLLSVAALCDKIKPERVVDGVMKNRESIPSHDALVIYARALWISRIVPSLRGMLRIEMSPQDRSAVFRHAVLLAFEEGLDLTQEIPVTEGISDPFVAIYTALRKLTDFNLDTIRFPSTKLLALKEYEQYGRRGDIEDLLYTTFFCFLGNHLWQQGKRNQEWLQEVGVKPWPVGFLHRLNAIASDCSRLLLSDSPPSSGWFYEQVKDFRRPSWPEDQEVYEYGVCAERAINRISLDMLILGMALGKNPEIVQDDLELAFASGYCHPEIWINVYVDRRRKWLSRGTAKWLLQEQDAQLASSIELMSERAFKYGQVASLAALHGLKTEAQCYLHEAASNLISYGDHKDILLYGALEAVQACHKAKLSEGRQWLLRLAPPIAGVRDFTDGDETRHMPRELADMLTEVAPDLLSAYYQWLCMQEEYHDALGAFHSFLGTADLSAEINQALARTAVDDESLAILVVRTEKGDQGAQKALSSLTALLGKSVLSGTEPEEELNESKTDSSPGEDLLPSPASFSPDRLSDYLTAAKAKQFYYPEECVRRWLEFWKSAGRGEEAFYAIEKEEKRGIEVGNYDAMFDLALSHYGKERAYPWLTRAHIKRYGWSRYFTYKEEALRRWRIVKNHYPDRWFSFLQDTMKATYGEPWRGLTIYDRFVRLIEYCLFMGQTESAKQISEQVIAGTLELVSPLLLPTPEWVNES